ncbi:MAG: radical SAM protein [Candidatus Methanomethylophilaceae archaeon]
MSLRKMGNGSVYSGELPTGCVHCQEGSKMVLLVSGHCGESCFYCPLSHEKKGHDTIYADETAVTHDEEIIREAESIGATGTGITGGDPLLCYERTLHLLRLLKTHFGPRHHVHLYTSTIDLEKVKGLQEAGLDEIRFHPPLDMWPSLPQTELSRILAECYLEIGLELPALPDHADALRQLMTDAFSMGVSFVNLNELEFSEGNWDMMLEHGYLVKDDISAAVKGSERLAKKLVKEFRGRSVHYCSSGFKDSVQLRRRLLRRAERTAREWELVTEDGTLVKGLVKTTHPAELMQALLQRGVPQELMHPDPERRRLEMAPWVLENLAAELGEPCFLVEESPTSDRMEVERLPLN